MKKITSSVAALMLASTAASAGGIDRSSQFVAPLFEDGGETGGYAQISVGRINPDAEGTVAAAGGLVVSNPLISYNAPGAALKMNFSDKLSGAVIIEEPYGADVGYELTSPFIGGGANVSSEQVSALLRYKINDNFSVYGGIRAMQLDGSIDTFTVIGGTNTPITLSASSSFDFGGVVGVAYERPDIAMRVALTYNTGIDAGMSGTETIYGDAARTIVAGTGATQFEVKFPKSYTLEFQTGIAPETLLFGSVRHARYNGFNLTTPVNAGIAGGAAGLVQYVNFTNNTTTYSLGVGRRFNENWAGNISLGYEGAGSRPSTTPLAPTTGQRSLSAGLRYSQDAYTISGGVSYIEPGDQSVASPVGVAAFNDNSAIAFGLRFGYNF